MSNEELKRALIERPAVRCQGIRYDYVSGIIYRTSKGKVYITAELTDRRSNSVTIAHAKEVEFAEDGERDAVGGVPYRKDEEC